VTLFRTGKITDFMVDIQSFSIERYEIALQIRKMYFDILPTINDDIKYGGLVFLKEGSLVGGVFFYKEHISVEFSYGSSLSDPNLVLEGKGKLRRHIKIRTLDDIAVKNVAHYVKEALAL